MTKWSSWGRSLIRIFRLIAQFVVSDYIQLSEPCIAPTLILASQEPRICIFVVGRGIIYMMYSYIMYMMVFFFKFSDVFPIISPLNVRIPNKI
jgi:hypothetical protein